MMPTVTKQELELVYQRYNRLEFVHPDPLECLYQYENVCDREIAGLIASSLAYGRVVQILKSVSAVLERMMPSPSAFLRQASRKGLERTFAEFKHRFTTGEQLGALLFGIKNVVEGYGSLYTCFLAGLEDDHATVLPALHVFTNELAARSHGPLGHLVPCPERGSACKRLNLFLRWMVRRDAVDPGGWEGVPVSKLIVPVDTHMHRVSLLLGLTRRKQADMRTAIEITDGFRAIAPEDPVKYDFALTRFGIRRDANLAAFLRQCNEQKADAGRGDLEIINRRADALNEEAADVLKYRAPL
jgi:uncharacterized protein (TIGR02757 family)